MEIYQNTSVTLESSIFARRTIAQENLGLFDAKEDSRPDASIAGEDGLAASFQSISIQACPPPINTPGPVVTSSQSVKFSRTTFNQPKDLLKGPTFTG